MTAYDDAFYENKLQQWESGLLDFTMRNKLLSLPKSSGGVVLVINEPGMDELWDQLVFNDSPMRFARRTRRDYENELKRYEEYQAKSQNGTLRPYDIRVDKPRPVVLGEHELMPDLSADDMYNRLKYISRRAQLIREERGVDTLYLAFGSVRWRDSKQTERSAPLILLPVSMLIVSRRSFVTLKASGGDPTGNLTFSVYANQKFGVQIPEYSFDDYSNLDDYFERVSAAVEKVGWQVERTTVLGVFSYAQISMYQDLVNNGETIIQHPVVRAICGDDKNLRALEANLKPLDEVKQQALDADASTSYQVLEADSSQEFAIQMANEGYSFVLQGPPGTGKSQTIANIITEALAHGKTVLFVSEKRAALDVVYQRLQQVGLDDFIFVLHSVKQNKKEAIKDPADQLDLTPSYLARDNQSKAVRYRNARTAIDAYEHDVHEVIQPFDKSMWDVYDELIRLDDEKAPKIRFNLAGASIAELSYQDFEQMRDAVDDLGGARAKVMGPVREHPWYGLVPQRMTEDFEFEIRNSAAAYLNAINAFINTLNEASSVCGVELAQSVEAASGIRDLLQGFEGTKVELRLLSLSDEELDRLDESLQRLTKERADYAEQIDKFERARSQSGEFVSGIDSSEELEVLITSIEKRFEEDEAFARWEIAPAKRITREIEGLDHDFGTARALRDEVLKDFRNEVFDEVDARALLKDFEGSSGKFSSGFNRLINHGEYQKVSSELESYRRISGHLTYDEQCKLLHQLESISAAYDRFDEERSAWQRDFPGLFTGADTDLDRIHDHLNEYHELKELLGAARELLPAMRAMEDDLTVVTSALDDAAAGIGSAFKGLEKETARIRPLRTAAQASGVDPQVVSRLSSSERAGLIKKLNRVLADLQNTSTPFRCLFESNVLPSEEDFHATRDRVAACAERADEVRTAMSYADTRADCCKLGLEDFVEQAEAEDLLGDQFLPVFERRVYVLWLEEVGRDRSSVEEFDAESSREDREEFRADDSEYIKTASLRVKDTLMRNLAEVQNGRDAALLRREASKKTGVKPLNKIFAEMPEFICKLKPCMMMSPLSVSTFLSSRSIMFDLVVFDEASQVCTQDAVGAISRGKQVIIAGDSHQLPPTSFFAASSGLSDDEEDQEEVEGTFDSVLEEAAQLQTVTLRWHYRSRNESLISFSNQEIYDRKLVTFPSSYEQREGEGVSFVYVRDGVWQGGKKGNPVEAQRTAELVFDHFERYPDRSLGVIAFSDAQANLIEQKIEKMRDEKEEEDPDLEDYFREDAEEPFFVKNLENVQGDERDSIIISVGYGRNDSGRVYQRFGPTNNSGGERRLNVAVTRAKHDLTLVSSMHDTDITLSSATSRGPELLRSYLAYAQRCEAVNRGGIRTTGGTSSQSSRWVEPEVHTLGIVERELTGRGYVVEHSIGQSSCKVDLGVKCEADDTDYVAGVVLDSPERASITVRERELIQPNMLHKMGWNLCQVQVQEWYGDLAGSLDELLDEVEGFAQNDVEELTVLDELATTVEEGQAAEPITEPELVQWESGTEERKVVELESDISLELADAVEPSNKTFAQQESNTKEENASEEPFSELFVAEKFVQEEASALDSGSDNINVPEEVVVENVASSEQYTQPSVTSRDWGEPDENGFYPYDEVDPAQFDDPEEFVREVLKREVPVSKSFIYQRLRKLYWRLGKSAPGEDQLATLVDKSCTDLKYQTVENHRIYKYIYDSADPVIKPRYGSARRLYQISPEERQEGLFKILKKYEHLTKDDLFNKTYKAFGFEDELRNLSYWFKEPLAALVAEGRARIDGSDVYCQNSSSRNTQKTASNIGFAPIKEVDQVNKDLAEKESPVKRGFASELPFDETYAKQGDSALDIEKSSRSSDGAGIVEKAAVKRAVLSEDDRQSRDWGEPDENGFYPYEEADPAEFDDPKEFVLEVLRRENPVSQNVVYQRLRQLYRLLGRTVPSDYKIAKIVNEVCESDNQEWYTVEWHTAKFIYGSEKPSVIPRRKGSRRIFDIPPAERQEGLLQVLKRYKSLTMEALFSKTYEAFSFDDELNNLAYWFKEQLNALVTAGYARIEDGYVCYASAATSELAENVTDAAEEHIEYKESTLVVPADKKLVAEALHDKVDFVPVAEEVAVKREEPVNDGSQSRGMPRNLGRPDGNGFYPYEEVNPAKFDNPVEFVREVLRKEAPVCRSFIEKRVRERFYPDRGRIGYIESAVVDRAIQGNEWNVFRQELVQVNDKQLKFIYKTGAVIVPRYKNGGTRDFDEIPPEELEEGVYQILTQHKRIRRDQLWKITYDAFGYQNLHEASKNRMNEAIDALVAEERAYVVGNLIEIYKEDLPNDFAQRKLKDDWSQTDSKNSISSESASSNKADASPSTAKIYTKQYEAKSPTTSPEKSPTYKANRRESSSDYAVDSHASNFRTGDRVYYPSKGYGRIERIEKVKGVRTFIVKFDSGTSYRLWPSEYEYGKLQLAQDAHSTQAPISMAHASVDVSNNVSNIEVGAVVSHKTFGVGIVAQIQQNSKGETYIYVDFENNSNQKQFNLRRAFEAGYLTLISPTNVENSESALEEISEPAVEEIDGDSANLAEVFKEEPDKEATASASQSTVTRINDQHHISVSFSQETDELIAQKEAQDKPDENGFYRYDEVDPAQFDDPKVFIRNVLYREAPVNRNFINRRLNEFYGQSSQTVDEVCDCEAEFVQEERTISISANTRFTSEFIYYKNASSIKPRRRGSRKFFEISPEELKEGLFQVLDKYGCLEKNELLSKTSNAFGFENGSNIFLNLLEEPLNVLVAEGKATIDDNLVINQAVSANGRLHVDVSGVRQGTVVKHKMFGIGTVAWLSYNLDKGIYVYINFKNETQVKRFKYQYAFDNKYLMFEAMPDQTSSKTVLEEKSDQTEILGDETYKEAEEASSSSADASSATYKEVEEADSSSDAFAKEDAQTKVFSITRGTVVFHNVFGRGKVRKIDFGYVYVDFEDGSLHAFKYPAVFKSGKLKTVE